MKKSNRALLFSALVCPGAGHFVLKRPMLGLLWMVPTIAATLYIMITAVSYALAIVVRIQDPAAVLNLNALMKLVADARVTNDPWTTASWAAIFACWAGSLIHTFWLAQRQDQSETSAHADHGAVEPDAADKNRSRRL